MNILIIGGYGRFGGNLARLLSDGSNLTLFIAGRSLEKAQAFCEAYRGEARVRPIAVDRTALDSVLNHHKFDVVVDASGPFQNYGHTRYSVVKACIARGIHYLDLADSADFVANISSLNEAAKEANILALSGLSTCPALSGTVVRTLAREMRVKDITIGIAPSPKAALGLSVIKAILSYAGTSLPTTRKGKADSYIGLAETRRFQIAPQNYAPLKNRLFAAVEAPDLALFPALYPDLENLWVGAGTRPEFLLRILVGLAKLKALFKELPLAPLAPLAHAIMSLCKFGPHRGGMFVTVSGDVAGQTITRHWHLIAEGDDGPLIPAMAADAIIRTMMKGKIPPAGARPAIHELTLEEFEAQFARHNIVSTHA